MTLRPYNKDAALKAIASVFSELVGVSEVDAPFAAAGLSLLAAEAGSADVVIEIVDPKQREVGMHNRGL